MQIPRRRPDSGLSIISLVFTLVILGLMAAIAVKIGDGSKKDSAETSGLLSQLGGAAGAADAIAGAAQAGAGGVGGLAGSAASAACKANVAIVERALATLTTQGESLPANIDELVSRGVISEIPAVRGYTLSLEVVDGRPTGKVLVNSRPAAEGCGP